MHNVEVAVDLAAAADVAVPVCKSGSDDDWAGISTSKRRRFPKISDCVYDHPALLFDEDREQDGLCLEAVLAECPPESFRAISISRL